MPGTFRTKSVFLARRDSSEPIGRSRAGAEGEGSGINIEEPTMDNQDVIATLNDLLEISRDGEQGFRTCAEGGNILTKKSLWRRLGHYRGRSEDSSDSRRAFLASGTFSTERRTFARPIGPTSQYSRTVKPWRLHGISVRKCSNCVPPPVWRSSGKNGANWMMPKEYSRRFTVALQKGSKHQI
jgi:hypothetical protein